MLPRTSPLPWLLCLWWSVASAVAQYHFDSWTVDTGLPQNSVHAILQTRDGYLWLATSDGLARFDGVRFTIFDRNNSPGISGNYLTSLYEDPQGALWIGAENNHVICYRGGAFTSYVLKGARTGDWVHAISGDPSGGPWVVLSDRVMHWENGRFSPVPSRGFPPPGAGPPLRVIEHTNRGGFWTVTPTGFAVFEGGRVSAWTRPDGFTRFGIQSVGKDEQGTVWVATVGTLVKIQEGKLIQSKRPPACLANSELHFVSSPVLQLACFSGQNTLSLIRLDSGQRREIGPVPHEFPRNLTSLFLYGDREHNLWLGTADQGLYRARKQPITVYSQRQGLRDRNVYPVLEDHTGAIWLGCWPGTLSKFEHGRFTNYTRKDGLSGEQITSLYEDRAGRLWVGAYGDGMRVQQDGHFVVPRGPPRLKVVQAILQDRQGAFWFGTEHELVRYQNGVSTTYTTQDGLASSDVRVLLEDAAGNVWIGGYNGLTRCHAGQFTAYTERDGLPSSNIRALYQDAQGVLWIGTYDGGLGRFQDGQFTRYTIRQGLFNNGVFQILEGARGNLWMSSNRGISRVSKKELNEFAVGQRTSVTSIAYGKGDGLRNVECNGGHWPAGAKARDGKLWFPTQDGVAVIDPKDLPSNAVPPPVIIESCLVDRASVAIDRGVRVSPGQDDLEIHYTALSLLNSERILFRYLLEGLDSAWVEAGTRRMVYYSHLPPGHYVFRVRAANSDGVWNTTGQALDLTVLAPFYQTWWFKVLALLSAAALVVFVWQYRVAEWKRARTAQLAFSRQLIASQESERKRVAAELHDSLGQSLAIIRNRALLSLQEPENHSRALEQLDEIAQGTADAVHELRQIAYHLRPHHLERLGLRKSIEVMLHELSRAEEISISADLDSVDTLLSPEAQINIYRIVQESAHNIVKHAQATEAKLTIRRAEAAVEILVQDNGRGFAPEEVGLSATPYHGFGLMSIAERARMLGGDLTIDSQPGKGTTLKITVAMAGRAKCETKSTF